jgi:hypothetical protein
MYAPFKWEADDLVDGGEWCEAQLDIIRTITEGWHDQDYIMVEARLKLVTNELHLS